MKKLFVLFMLLICLVAVGCYTEGCNDSRTDVSTNVTVSDKTNYIQIEPVNEAPRSCYIFYPGAMIEPADYISPLHLIAAHGHRVLILKPLMNMAIFSIGMASKAMKDFNDIDTWIIGGHSLGGVAAVKAILKNPEGFKALILMASYPDANDDLSDWAGAVLSISAENDGLTTPEDIEQSKTLLPQALDVDNLTVFPNFGTKGRTIFFEIAGGNHAQFGSYGEQNNDGQATISEEEQHEMIKELVTRFIAINNW